MGGINENTLLKRMRMLSLGRQFNGISKGPVIYWMNRDQRGEDNWGLLYAQNKAENLGTPLVVVFFLVRNYLGASVSQYGFMLNGLKETAQTLRGKGIPFHLFQQSPEVLLPIICNDWETPLLVTDFNPLRVKVDWERNIAGQVDCPIHQVDSHNIVPCWEASQKLEYAAYTFRPRLLKKLKEFLVEYPDLQEQQYPQAWASNDDWMKEIDGEQPTNRWYPTPGTGAALEGLASFIDVGIKHYATLSHNPLKKSVSTLSPYLHFGQLSAARCAIEVMKNSVVDENREGFLEQLIVRRELSDNFCWYQSLYDKPAAFPDWGKTTLAVHRHDPREYLYTRDELEQCHTHDALWNAAQKEMIVTGYLHGYLRMYWAKKILEWTPNPETAQEYAIYLNDSYLLDGRDPNGYTGIAWSIGGVHDRAWTERPVFGKIRYMNEKGCRRKFDVDGYIDYVANLESAGGKQGEPIR